MKKLLFIVICIAIVLSVNVLTAGAQATDNGADPGLLPDSPFYFMKQLWEGLRETFTLRSEAKLQYMEKLGEKRILEAQKMIEKGKPEQAERVMTRYNDRLQKMEQLIEKKGAKIDEKLDGAQERIQNRFEHRNEVLQGVLERTPEAARVGLQRALNNSKSQLQRLDEKFQDQIKRRNQRNEQLRLRLQNINTDSNINQ